MNETERLLTQREGDKITRDVARLSRQLDDLAVRDRSREAQLGEIKTKVFSHGPRDWYTQDDYEVAATWMLDLELWVQTVLRFEFGKFPDSMPCWHHHPPVVQHLLALQRSWVEAYVSGAPARSALDLAVSYMPNSLKRIDGIMKLSGCDAHKHTVGDSDQYLVTVEPEVLAEYARWWASTFGRTDIPEPGLTRKR